MVAKHIESLDTKNELMGLRPRTALIQTLEQEVKVPFVVAGSYAGLQNVPHMDKDDEAKTTVSIHEPLEGACHIFQAVGHADKLKQA